MEPKNKETGELTLKWVCSLFKKKHASRVEGIIEGMYLA